MSACFQAGRQKVLPFQTRSGTRFVAGWNTQKGSCSMTMNRGAIFPSGEESVSAFWRRAGAGLLDEVTEIRKDVR